MAQAHYVNNQDLLKALIEHRQALKEAKKTKQTPPELSEYLGTCFLKIAEHLSRKPNFMSYTFREDMISDAVENCIQYVNNFNPAKSKNPFAYFTQIIYFAFLRRISKEKKQLYVKYKATEQLGILQNTEMHDLDGIGQGGGKAFQVYENITEFIQTFEQGRKNKKRTKKSTKTATRGTLKFIGD
jgi:hypothetical protein